MYTYVLRIVIFILLIIISVQLDKDIKITHFYLASTWTIFLLAISFHMLYKNLNTHTKLGLFLFLLLLLIIHTIFTHTYLKKIKNKKHYNIIIVTITLIWLYFAFIYKKIFTIDIYEEKDNNKGIYQSSIKPNLTYLNNLHSTLLKDRSYLLNSSDLGLIKSYISNYDHNTKESNLAKRVFEINTMHILIPPVIATENISYIEQIIDEMQTLAETDTNIKNLLTYLKTYLQNNQEFKAI